MKKLILNIIFLFFLSNIYGQSIVTGIVTDQGNEPLIGVYVMLYQDGNLINKVITDFDGQYTINVNEFGSYSIETSYIGYINQKINLSISKEIQIEDFWLKESFIINCYVIFEYNPPLFELSEGSSNAIYTNEHIQRMPY